MISSVSSSVTLLLLLLFSRLLAGETAAIHRQFVGRIMGSNRILNCFISRARSSSLLDCDISWSPAGTTLIFSPTLLLMTLHQPTADNGDTDAMRRSSGCSAVCFDSRNQPSGTNQGFSSQVMANTSSKGGPNGGMFG